MVFLSEVAALPALSVTIAVFCQPLHLVGWTAAACMSEPQISRRTFALLLSITFVSGVGALSPHVVQMFLNTIPALGCTSRSMQSMLESYILLLTAGMSSGHLYTV